MCLVDIQLSYTDEGKFGGIRHCSEFVYDYNFSLFGRMFFAKLIPLLKKDGFARIMKRPYSLTVKRDSNNLLRIQTFKDMSSLESTIFYDLDTACFLVEQITEDILKVLEGK